MNVTVCKCRQHGRAAEVDALGADSGRLLSDGDDLRTVESSDACRTNRPLAASKE